MQTTSLSELQSWFLTVMTATGGAQQGVALARQRFGLDAMQVVAQSSDAAALRRMYIYAEGYVLRLLECLQADYPVLHKVMGDALFGFFARAYIARHPSTSPTLYDLGAGFAEFLRGSQREAAPEMRGLLLLPVELARLEHARTEVTRARGLERQPRRFTHSPFDLMMGVPLQISTPPCLRLLQLDLPLLGFWEGISRGGEVPAAPELAHSYVAITRMHYRVNL
ncbi:MAG: putative DNA-binding domain-containing protein, partial [Burkholderiales bacterium]|nr:putative DNA-binding domain-containing protein [Burkholderiales bacterium]